MQGGLSPLARGTQFLAILCIFFFRFIPAGAGNTLSCAKITPFFTVYPRWRGEHKTEDKSIPWEDGLSPLARGTPDARTVKTLFTRFIPAGAGNTFATLCVAKEMAVYPRWRGEHVRLRTLINGYYGLSPLARGTQGGSNAVIMPPRFIPAGAGNTSSGTRAHRR